MLTDMKARQTIKAIRSGQVDAGVWNLDGILETDYKDLNMVPVSVTAETAKYSSAALVVAKKNQEMAQLLRQVIRPEMNERQSPDVLDSAVILLKGDYCVLTDKMQECIWIEVLAPGVYL